MADEQAGNRAQAESMGLAGNEFAIRALDAWDRVPKDDPDQEMTGVFVFAMLAIAAEVRRSATNR